jgi:hypothetical protein
VVVTGWLRRLAAGAPVPVFPVAGLGGREIVQDLRRHRSLHVVDAPRQANVLLVAGTIPDALDEPLRRVHDNLSHPRCTVLAGPDSSPRGADELLPEAVAVAEGGDVVDTIVSTHGELLSGARASDRPLLPDVDPAPWRGAGPYGQGGSGMTGGTPYGRPMAGLVDDRDGLRLDAVSLAVGPFFPRLPPGLTLAVQWAGDVVVDASVEPNPFVVGDPDARDLAPLLRPFVRALTEPVAIAELELARARSHLRWLAEALTAHGLDALGSRALALATGLGPDDAGPVRRLGRLIDWSQVLRWSTKGVGRIDAEALAGLGAGPVARASGLAEDARLDDPAYGQLGFQPVVQDAGDGGDGGDAPARWRQRLAEVLQSLDLAARAGDRRAEPRGVVESPRGRLVPGEAATASVLELLPGLIVEREWGDAVATIVSLDLDLEAVAVAEGLAAGRPAA